MSRTIDQNQRAKVKFLHAVIHRFEASNKAQCDIGKRPLTREQEKSKIERIQMNITKAIGDTT